MIMANFQGSGQFHGNFFSPQHIQNSSHIPLNMGLSAQYAETQPQPPIYNHPQASGQMFSTNNTSFTHNNQFPPHAIPPPHSSSLPRPPIPPPLPLPQHPHLFGSAHFASLNTNSSPPSLPTQPIPTTRQFYPTLTQIQNSSYYPHDVVNQQPGSHPKVNMPMSGNIAQTATSLQSEHGEVDNNDITMMPYDIQTVAAKSQRHDGMTLSNIKQSSATTVTASNSTSLQKGQSIKSTQIETHVDHPAKIAESQSKSSSSFPTENSHQNLSKNDIIDVKNDFDKPQVSGHVGPPSDADFEKLSVTTKTEHEINSRRQNAKIALSQLQELGFSYVQLLNENIDQRILNNLYLDLGLPPINTTKDGHASLLENTLDDSIDERAFPSNHSLISRATSDSSLEPGEVPENENAANLVRKNGEMSSQGLSGQHRHQEGLSKSSKIEPKKPLDRKDYVARLLAAKQSVQKPPEKASKPITEPSIKIGPLHPSLSLPSVASKASVAKLSEINLDSKKSENKDPVQTQLVRQRLEALKNSGKTAKPSILPPSKGEIVKTSNSAIHKNSEVEANGQAKQYGAIPSQSFFVSSGQTSFGPLPGLSPVNSSLPGLPLSTDNVIQSVHVSPAFTGSEINAMNIGTNIKVSSEKTQALRKRATASDFIDSPPRQNKRLVGSAEPISVVIEVSDEEDDRDNDYPMDDVDTSIAPDEQLTISKTIEESNPLQNVPTATHLPSRGSASSLTNAPSSYQSPTDLAAHEEGIKALRQKIHEYELRKKAKKALAGKQLRNSAPNENLWLFAQHSSQIDDIRNQQHDKVDTDSEVQRKSLKDLETAIVTVDDKMSVDEQQQALSVVRVEDERQNTAKTKSTAERHINSSRKSALQDSLAKLETKIKSARDQLGAIRMQQNELESQIEKNIINRDNLEEELKILLSDKPRTDTPSVDLDMNRSESVFNDRQLMHRGRQSSVGISEIQGVSQARNSPHETHNGTVNPSEPEAIPRAGILLEDSMDISSADENHVIRSESNSKSRTTNIENRSGYLASSDKRLHIPRPSPNSSESHDDLYEPEEELVPNQKLDTEVQVESAVQSSNASEPESDYEPLDNHLLKDAEISHRNGENDIVEKEQNTALQKTVSITYRDDSCSRRSTNGFLDEMIGPDSASKERAASHGATMSITSSSIMGKVSVANSPSDADNAIANEENEVTELYHRAVTDAFTGEVPSTVGHPPEGELVEGQADESDYEPPEPSSTTHNTLTSSNQAMPIATPLQNFPPVGAPSSDSNGDSSWPISANGSQMDADEEKEKNTIQPIHRRFTPYQSPLSQFSSYRFHPQYVSQIPGGFRSLTYNHKIDQTRQICPWELAGGVCNDNSCIYQHFREISLSGSEILVSLIDVREGDNEESKQDYVKGLKQLINDMQSRNINDVDSVASEIVAYRSTFLRDSSRVLTNL